jgi:MFS transporter, SP family, sugar:H+ symporter
MVDSGAGNANLGSKVFFVWGGFCVICCVFVHFCIYETKGLSLEQVDELFAKVNHAWQSKDFRATVNFRDVQEVPQEEARRMSLVDLENAANKRKESVVVQAEKV